MTLAIDKKVKNEVLKRYLEMCQYQHLIAFGQWRLIYYPEKTRRLMSRYRIPKPWFDMNEEYLCELFKDNSLA